MCGPLGATIAGLLHKRDSSRVGCVCHEGLGCWLHGKHSCAAGKDAVNAQKQAINMHETQSKCKSVAQGICCKRSMVTRSAGM
jgi:hypothetical protein